MEEVVVMKEHKRIREGDVLIKEEPFVYVLGSKVHSQYCDSCFKKGNLLKCSSCQYVHYCNKECQREAWSVHKPECQNLKRVLPKIVPDAARLLARLIRKLQKGGDMVKAYYTEGNFRMFKDLMSHYSDIKENPRKMEHFVSLCAVLREFLGPGTTVPNSAELMGMYGRMCVNSFNICDSELVPLGTGIYLGASVIDHSCKPNAVATFEGTTLYVRALEPMPYLDWSQIHISYIDVMNTTAVRRNELQYTYYFVCQCPKCSDPKESEYMAAAACPNSACDACVDIKNLHDMKCSKCGTAVTNEFVRKYYEVTEFTEMHLKNMQQTAYLDICRFCLERQDGVLHETNVLHVKTLDLAFQSSIDYSSWEDAKKFAHKLIPAYRLYYGNVHPLMGLLRLKLGKILLYEAKSKEALVHLKEAYDILKITHGGTSSLFRQELLPLLQQAKLESERM